MAENNEQWVFVVDEDLIEKLMGNDSVDSNAKKRPLGVTALSKVLSLQTQGRTQDALKEVERAIEKGETLPEIYATRGHLQFELQRWGDAASSYAKLAEIDANDKTAQYNLGLALEKLERYQD
ncbi:MAG: tetratricopeptide repeat protein, partial [Pseudomonadota bacterium]